MTRSLKRPRTPRYVLPSTSSSCSSANSLMRPTTRSFLLFLLGVWIGRSEASYFRGSSPLEADHDIRTKHLYENYENDMDDDQVLGSPPLMATRGSYSDYFEPVHEMRRRLGISYNYTPIALHPEDCRALSEAQCQAADQEKQRYIRKERQRARDHRTRRLQSQTTATDNFGQNDKGLILLMQFTDHHNRTLPDVKQYKPMWEQKLPAWLAENSYGTHSPTFQIVDWQMTDNTEQYYSGGEFGRVPYFQESIWPLLSALDDDPNWDWADFDSDGDFEIDNVIVLHSGYLAEHMEPDCTNDRTPEEMIWSQWSFNPEGWTSADGKYRMKKFLVTSAYDGFCGNEPARLGTLTMNYLTSLGLTSLYDQSNSTTKGNGVGWYDAMAFPHGVDGTSEHPSPLSAYSKMLLEWLVPTEIMENQVITISPATVADDAYIIRSPYGYGEYLLIENRQPVGSDRFAPSGGLIIYHIDELADGQKRAGYPGQEGWPENGNHYEVAVVQQDGNFDLEQGVNLGDEGDYFKTGMSLGPGQGGTVQPNTDGYQYGFVWENNLRIDVLLECDTRRGQKVTFEVTGLSGTEPEGGSYTCENVPTTPLKTKPPRTKSPKPPETKEPKPPQTKAPGTDISELEPPTTRAPGTDTPETEPPQPLKQTIPPKGGLTEAPNTSGFLSQPGFGSQLQSGGFTFQPKPQPIQFGSQAQPGKEPNDPPNTSGFLSQPGFGSQLQSGGFTFQPKPQPIQFGSQAQPGKEPNDPPNTSGFLSQPGFGSQLQSGGFTFQPKPQPIPFGSQAQPQPGKEPKDPPKDPPTSGFLSQSGFGSQLQSGGFTFGSQPQPVAFGSQVQPQLAKEPKDPPNTGGFLSQPGFGSQLQTGGFTFGSQPQPVEFGSQAQPQATSNKQLTLKPATTIPPVGSIANTSGSSTNAPEAEKPSKAPEKPFGSITANEGIVTLRPRGPEPLVEQLGTSVSSEGESVSLGSSHTGEPDVAPQVSPAQVDDSAASEEVTDGEIGTSGGPQGSFGQSFGSHSEPPSSQSPRTANPNATGSLENTSSSKPPVSAGKSTKAPSAPTSATESASADKEPLTGGDAVVTDEFSAGRSVHRTLWKNLAASSMLCWVITTTSFLFY